MFLLIGVALALLTTPELKVSLQGIYSVLADRFCPNMFVVISETSISIQEETLNLKLMQQLVGITNQPAYIEFVSNEFSDPSIDLICDDEFLLKNFSPTCITPCRRHILHGQVIAAGRKGSETVGLTKRQLEVIKQELIVIRNLISVPAKTFWPDVSKSLRT